MPVCMTVDVEDWYDGMAELGHAVDRRAAGPGLGALKEALPSASGTSGPPTACLTLFVVGKYAPQVAEDLRDMADGGHEIASHGPDHGVLPDDPAHLENWLREGRERVEEIVERPIVGFRSPKFAVPGSLKLEHYRELLARAGFQYVSDRHCVGSSSAVREIPVLQWRGIPIGGGSYQRLLPTRSVTAIVRRFNRGPTVLYYHSYDFGGVLPSLRENHSPAVLRYSAGRQRIQTIFSAVLSSMGSVACREALSVV